jgi:hypothetical protein
LHHSIEGKNKYTDKDKENIVLGFLQSSIEARTLKTLLINLDPNKNLNQREGLFVAKSSSSTNEKKATTAK